MVHKKVIGLSGYRVIGIPNCPLTISNYENLKVWQTAYTLTIKIYMLTKKLPKDEQFGLISQIRRAAVSVESNLAEGEARYTKNDKIKFFIDARSSAAEVETQLLIIKDLYRNLLSEAITLRTHYKLLGKQINSLISFRRNT